MSAFTELSSVMPYSHVTQHHPAYTLYRGGGDLTCYPSSPFVVKVELRFRLAGVPYKTDCGAPWLGPKKKIPYLKLSFDDAGSDAGTDTILGDSALIIKHLTEKEGIEDLNTMLSPTDKAKDLALRALLEDKLYFYHMRECWIDNYYAQRDQALSGVPFPVRMIVGQIVYKKVVRTLFGQGAGRYDPAEVESFRNEIWESIEDLLSAARSQSGVKQSDEPYWCLGGAEATEADITLYGFISSILTGTSCPASSSLLRSLPSVMDYAGLIHKKYFPDYEQWLPDEKALVDEPVTVLARI